MTVISVKLVHNLNGIHARIQEFSSGGGGGWAFQVNNLTCFFFFFFFFFWGGGGFSLQKTNG